MTDLEAQNIYLDVTVKREDLYTTRTSESVHTKMSVHGSICLCHY